MLFFVASWMSLLAPGATSSLGPQSSEDLLQVPICLAVQLRIKMPFLTCPVLCAPSEHNEDTQLKSVDNGVNES